MGIDHFLAGVDLSPVSRVTIALGVALIAVWCTEAGLRYMLRAVNPVKESDQADAALAKKTAALGRDPADLFAAEPDADRIARKLKEARLAEDAQELKRLKKAKENLPYDDD